MKIAVAREYGSPDVVRIEEMPVPQGARKGHDNPFMTSVSALTSTIDVPGARIVYDVRPGTDAGQPPLMLIGSPMAAAGFHTLASHFPERTIVTYDPRGAERSKKDDDTSESTPEQHAEDLHRVIEDVGGSVDLFASSGGAVNALALVAAHPEDVRILVAHEPPIASLLPDRDNAYGATQAIVDTYRRRGQGAAIAKFIALVGYPTPIPDDYADQVDPDPQMFGLVAEDDGSRNDTLMQNIVTCTHYEPDFAALAAAPTRIVIAVGEGSGETLARRGGEAVAAGLGIAHVEFPGDHGGFLGGEYGQTGDPDAFAEQLRHVLATA